MKAKVVPLPSERWATVIGPLPHFSCSQVLILPRKMSTACFWVSLRLAQSALLKAMAMVPPTAGNWITPRLTLAASSRLIGSSVAPKSTEPAMNWRTPAPEPTD